VTIYAAYDEYNMSLLETALFERIDALYAGVEMQQVTQVEDTSRQLLSEIGVVCDLAL